jgi:hypothetical protein
MKWKEGAGKTAVKFRRRRRQPLLDRRISGICNGAAAGLLKAGPDKQAPLDLAPRTMTAHKAGDPITLNRLYGRSYEEERGRSARLK